MDELLINHAPLATRVFEHVDSLGVPHALVVARATWDLVSGKQRTLADGYEALSPVRGSPAQCAAGELTLDATQRIVLGTRAEQLITVADHDLVPPKPRFDVIVQGYAHAPNGKQVTQFEAGLSIGEKKAAIRLLGPRCWQRGVAGTHASEALALVNRVPIHYGFAFSDCSIRMSDESLSSHIKHRSATEWHEEDISIPPWIEAANQSVTSRQEARSTACLGHWPEHASHRHRFIGTFDADWNRHRAPKLPLDFDARFYNVADPELQLDGPPKPGTPLHLVNLSKRGVESVTYPNAEVSLTALYSAGASRVETIQMRADTLIFEPENERYSIAWRALIPIRAGNLRNISLNYSGGAQ